MKGGIKFLEVELPSNYKFGIFFSVVFLILATYFFIENKMLLSYSSSAVCFSLTIVTLFNPDKLLPFNKLWMKLGLLIGMVVSPITLGVIFFGIFTPVSFLMKLFRRDELKLNFKSRQSYWKKRGKNQSLSETFKNQF